MDDAEVRPHRVVVVAACAVLMLLLAVATAFGLLHVWKTPAGGEQGSAALIDSIPQPRLQPAPQLDWAERSRTQKVGQGNTGPDAGSSLEFEQMLGSTLPRGLNLFDADGYKVDWNALAASRQPIVLLPAYYRCRTLCGTVAHGALEALADTGLPAGSWRLLLFSIDPQDTPADANKLKAAYADYAAWARPAVFGKTPPDLRLLTGAAADTRRLARTIGFHWIDQPSLPDLNDPQFAHATGLVVLTPGGVVSRYLLGVRFDPSILRAAIVEAADGEVGTLTDRLLLACSHLDPRLGTHGGQVLALMRALGLLVLGGLGFWIWRHRKTAARTAP